MAVIFIFNTIPLLSIYVITTQAYAKGYQSNA